MAIRKIPIAAVSAKFLAEHGSIQYGLSLRANDGLPAIIAKIEAAGFPTDFINYDDGLEEDVLPQAAVARAPFKRHIDGQRSVKISINSQQDIPGGQDDVFVSVNGERILIKRGGPVWIKHMHYEALMHAESKIPSKQDENMKILEWANVPLYPVNLLSMEPPLSKAEVEAAARAEQARLERIEREKQRQFEEAEAEAA